MRCETVTVGVEQRRHSLFGNRVPQGLGDKSDDFMTFIPPCHGGLNGDHVDREQKQE
jgi:hypothetical protein